ncbi:MAG: hypothetical protein DMF06_09340 [Verrucomicrobia bacterium]|nr:MAG: hypothetical protein DMF06_09340 [Verrucomicrobiota bacterium]
MHHKRFALCGDNPFEIRFCGGWQVGRGGNDDPRVSSNENGHVGKSRIFANTLLESRSDLDTKRRLPALRPHLTYCPKRGSRDQQRENSQCPTLNHAKMRNT